MQKVNRDRQSVCNKGNLTDTAVKRVNRGKTDPMNKGQSNWYSCIEIDKDTVNKGQSNWYSCITIARKQRQSN